MAENFEYFKKIVAYARKNGLTSVKIDGIEFELSPSAHFPESAYKQKKAAETQSEDIQSDAYTDEDVLFWSSQGIN